MSKTPAITRKDMKEPDKFQQAATQAASWISTRRKHVVAAGAVAVAVMVVIAVLAAIQSRREERAGAAAADLLTAVGGEISSVPLPGLPGPFYASEEERQRAIVSAADRILGEFGGTSAGHLAALAKGDAHLKLRQWEDAQRAYERYLSSADKRDSLRFGALEGIGMALEGKGDVAAAAQAYERLAREVPAFADRADLERARVLASSGNTAEAKALLASFAEKHKDSLLTGEASEPLARLGGK
jgi:tetratricopeptide (TPR) repeat protein